MIGKIEAVVVCPDRAHRIEINEAMSIKFPVDYYKKLESYWVLN